MFGAMIPRNARLAMLNIFTEIGLVIGLISKHGVLMVAYVDHRQDSEGLSRREAIDAIHLPPILMTTAAMVAGMVPLLVASGTGAARRRAPCKWTA